MTESQLSQQHQATFDGIRHRDDQGNEYWLARDLAPLLEYPQWRNFLPVLTKAREACRQTGARVRRFKGRALGDRKVCANVGMWLIKEVSYEPSYHRPD